MDEKLFLVKISELIKKLRLEKGISQEELSNRIDIDRKYASLIEKGDRNVSIIMLRKVTKGLNISLESFFKKLEF